MGLDHAKESEGKSTGVVPRLGAASRPSATPFPSTSSSSSKYGRNEQRNANRRPSSKINDDDHDKNFCAESSFESVRPYLSIMRLNEVISEIHSALDAENREIQREIRLVQSGVDDGVDYLSPISSNRSADRDRDHACDESSYMRELEAGLSTRLEGLSIKVPGARRIGPGDHGVVGKAGKALLSKSSMVASRSQPSLAPVPQRQQQEQLEAMAPRPAKGGSRVRGRLQAAKDEKYFLDDDFF
jgi:hypothetical protein